MTEEEFSQKLEELLAERKSKLKELNSGIVARLSSFPIAIEMRNEISQIIKEKAVEIKAEEKERLRSVQASYNNEMKEVLMNKLITESERTEKLAKLRDDLFAEIRVINNGMIAESEEYVQRIFDNYKSLYDTQIMANVTEVTGDYDELNMDLQGVDSKMDFNPDVIK